MPKEFLRNYSKETWVGRVCMKNIDKICKKCTNPDDNCIHLIKISVNKIRLSENYLEFNTLVNTHSYNYKLKLAEMSEVQKQRIFEILGLSTVKYYRSKEQ